MSRELLQALHDEKGTGVTHTQVEPVQTLLPENEIVSQCRLILKDLGMTLIGIYPAAQAKAILLGHVWTFWGDPMRKTAFTNAASKLLSIGICLPSSSPGTQPVDWVKVDEVKKTAFGTFNAVEVRSKRIQFSAAGACSISDALYANETITQVTLVDTDIGNAGACVIADMLKVNRSITHLALVENAIDGDGARALADALAVNNTLTTVDLSRNLFGSEGATKIAEALKVNTSVTSINLRSNLITAEGATAIAEALKQNSTLTTVDLGFNDIGNEGAHAIGCALKINQTLTTIDISSNVIGDPGALAIGDALHVNSTLERVCTEWNWSISTETCKGLYSQLTQRKRLIKTGSSALFTIFPSSKRALWPVNDSCSNSFESNCKNDSHECECHDNALIDSFFCSPIFDVQVFRIIRSYVISHGFTGLLQLSVDSDFDSYFSSDEH
jgi:Leucine Rich repeat